MPTHQSPLLSIVTVVLNNREGFARTARSVAAQEGAHFEWLVIDGGSVDGTIEIIESYSTQIDNWLSEPDNGLYDAMNKGIEMASGEYLLFLNSSDYLYRPNSLRLVQEIVKSDNQIDMLLGAAIRRYPSGVCFLEAPRQVTGRIRHRVPASHQATWIRRSIYQRIPFDTSYRLCADYHAISRMLALDLRCAYTTEPLVVVEHGGKSHSYCHPFRNALEAARVQKNVLGLKRSVILRSVFTRMASMVAERALCSRMLAPAASVMIARFIGSRLVELADG